MSFVSCPRLLTGKRGALGSTALLLVSSLALVAALVSLTSQAKATTLTFNLENANFSPLTAKGNIKIDTTTGLVVAGDFVAAGIDFSIFSSQSRQNGFYQVLFIDTSFDGFFLDLPVLNLVGYTGGNICADVAVECNGVSSQISYFETTAPFFVNLLADTGSLQQVTQATVTPEPSTLVLLGTGILGAAGAIRRRYAPNNEGSNPVTLLSQSRWTDGNTP